MQRLSKINGSMTSESLVGALIALVVFGSIWGLIEATLGGFLHLIHVPPLYKGAITGGIGMALMATFVTTYKRPTLVFWIGVIAALFKPLSAMIYAQPVFAPFVVNPATAIVLEALGFCLVASLLHKGFESSVKTRVTVGVSAGYLGFILFAIVASAMGFGKWPMMGITDKLITTLSNGTALALVGTLLLLPGHVAGRQLRPILSAIKPRTFYAGAAVSIVFCWAIASLVFAAGL